MPPRRSSIPDPSKATAASWQAAVTKALNDRVRRSFYVSVVGGGGGAVSGITQAQLDAALPHTILNSTYHTDSLTGTVVAGDIIRGNSTPKWSRLAIGSAGEVLTVSGGLPVWAAPSGLSTTVDWYKNSSLVGTRGGGNFIEGDGVTIDAADDSGNDQVDYTLNARFPLGKPVNYDIGQWVGGIINRASSSVSGIHAPYMQSSAATPLSIQLRYALPIGGWIGDPMAYYDDTLGSAQLDCFVHDTNVSRLDIAGGASNAGFEQPIFTTPGAAAGYIESENLPWQRVDIFSCVHMASKALTSGGSTAYRNWSALFAPDGNYQFVGGSTAGAVGFGTPVYNSPFGFFNAVDETEVEMVVPFACTIDRLVYWLTATQTTESADVMFRKNEGDTALTINIANGSLAGPYRDFTNTVACVAGDRVNLKTTQNVSGTSAAARAWFVRVTPSSGSPRWIGAVMDDYNHNRGNDSWGMLFQRWCGSSLTDANTRMPCPRPGTLSTPYLWVKTAGTSTATLDVSFTINGTPGNPTVNVVAATGAGAILGTGTQAVVRGDLCNLKVVTGGAAGTVPDAQTWSAIIE